MRLRTFVVPLAVISLIAGVSWLGFTMLVPRGAASPSAMSATAAPPAATAAISADLAALRAGYRRPTEIPFPAENPYTPERAALGKALFFDQRLSGARNLSCASCHNPSFGWESPSRTSVGAANVPLGRQSPTVLNAAWNHPLFWDGRAATLEAQARGPIEADVEMNLPMAQLVERLGEVEGYRDWFARVFPDGITEANITAAIATFERTVTASYAPFDAWVDGDENAISESARRGFALFNGRARCSGCHTGWNFTDNRFHDIGVAATDIGRGRLEPNNPHAQFAFKTPSLRDIERRAPYMHDGSLQTLEQTLIHYVTGGIERPSRSPLMRPVELTPEEIADLLAFMRTLTGERSTTALPTLPN